MSTRKASPQTPELPGMPISGKGLKNASRLVNSQGRIYKGGRILPFAIRFRYWRETEDMSLAKIAARLEERTREFGMDGRYLLTRLYELEQGRFKPPTWLILLLIETFGIKFPWREFHEQGGQP